MLDLWSGWGSSSVLSRPVRQLLRLGMDGDVLSCWTGAPLTASDASVLVSADSTAADKPFFEDESELWGFGLVPWAPPRWIRETDNEVSCWQKIKIGFF